MTVTNGVVEYERVVRPADFESKRAKVSLSFAVEDGSDTASVVAKVMNMAVAEVHRRLGINVEASGAQETVPTRTEHSALSPEHREKVAENTKKRAKAPPAEVPGENPPVTGAATEPSTNASAATVSAADPAAIGEPEEDILLLTNKVEPIVYTDKDLHAAVQTAIEKKVTATQIRSLTTEFTGNVGQSMTTLPQEKRADFIAKVKALYDA